MLAKAALPREADGEQRPGKHPANDNSVGSVSSPNGDREEAEHRYRLAAFPAGTSVLILRRDRLVNQIGRAREDECLLDFNPQSRLFVDPLTGWTGASDPLQHGELRFATLEEANCNAERHALPYRINAKTIGQPFQSGTKETHHEHAA